MLHSEIATWIEQQQSAMHRLLVEWGNLNSGSLHRAGVQRQADAIAQVCSERLQSPQRIPLSDWQTLAADGLWQAFPLGQALSLRQRPEATRQVLLAIHYDTVYTEASPFQQVHQQGERLHGPGVADAKGGLIVLLFALQALERFVEQTGIKTLGWEVLLNSDEELGSPCSAALFEQAAPRNQIGLLFEPALPDGGLAGNRKGSANFQIVCRGRSAHAGRDFQHGRNAVVAAAQLAVNLHALNGAWPETTLNVARIDGGGPLNMVPETAVLRLNVRYRTAAQESEILAALHEMLLQLEPSGIRTELHGGFTAPPKWIGGETQRLYEQVCDVAAEMGTRLNWRTTGGVCDGNRLAAAGLPNVDTLGVRGDNIHSPEEFMWLPSLTERVKWTAALLIGWASGDLAWPVTTRQQTGQIAAEQPASMKTPPR